ncbi:MAG: PDDEXK nuclease domain-containing protein [Bacteroidota bacterium]
MKPSKSKYNALLKSIGQTIERAQTSAYYAINTGLVAANWNIGRHIIEFEQLGKERAEYGSELLARLSTDLTTKHGKGFGRRNVLDMRRFYLAFPIWQAVPAKLSWSHIITLIGVSDDNARNFYLKQAQSENWGYRELERQINSSLYERLALSRNKKEVKKLAQKGNIIMHPHEIVKDPYVLDFLKIPQSSKVTEKFLEQKIIDNLQLFLMELGKGFAFIGRQYKISIRNKHYYVDLVFYHRILKCFVLIDLKTSQVVHSDVGQMNLYLNYFIKEENVEGDNQPIGIILAKDKDEILVEYTMGGMNNKIMVTKYELYLPDKKILKRRLKGVLGK